MLPVESIYDVTFTWPDGEVLAWRHTATSTDRALLLSVADLNGTDRDFNGARIEVERVPA